MSMKIKLRAKICFSRYCDRIATKFERLSRTSDSKKWRLRFSMLHESFFSLSCGDGWYYKPNENFIARWNKA